MSDFSEPVSALPEHRPPASPAEPSHSPASDPAALSRATDDVKADAEPIIPTSAWDVGTKRTVVIILLIVGVVFVWAIRPVIPMLVIAGVIAYFLSPVVDFFQRLRVPRAISTLILFILFLVGVVLTPILLVPILLNQLASLNFDVPTTAYRLFAWLGNTVNTLPDTMEILGFAIPLDGVTQQIEQNFTNFAFIPTLAEILSYIQQLISTATNVVSSTAAIGFSVVGGILQVVVTFLLVFFMSLYLTKDAPSIRRYIEGLFPRNYQSEWIDLLRRMGVIWHSFFRGQLILCFVVGFVTWGALELAGMPGALILGIVAGALEIIPTLGPIIAMIPAVIIALIQGSPVLMEYGINNFGFALITAAIYFIIQQLENYILVPRIIGNGVNLHPIVVLVGVTVGFNLFGILGALFAAPVLASLRVLGAYIHAKLLDYSPMERQVLAPNRRLRPLVYRRTVTGDELAARDEEEQQPDAPDAQSAKRPTETRQDERATDDALTERGSTTQALNAP